MSRPWDPTSFEVALWLVAAVLANYGVGILTGWMIWG